MLWSMKGLVPVFAILVLLGCEQEATEEGGEEADTTAMADTIAMTGISLADLAGTWNIRTTAQDPGDTLVTEARVVIDGTSWTLHLADRDPIQATAMVEGESVIVDAGPYESVRRPGTTVTTHGVYRLEGDRLVGDVTAHYVTADADSVIQLRAEGTRAP